MIVIDNSALTELVTKSSLGARVLQRVDSEDLFTAPTVLESEILSSLLGMKAGRKITDEEFENAFSRFIGLNIKLYSPVPHKDRIKELRANLGAYDATYVALAEFLRVPLITSDARIAKGLGPNYNRCVIETF